MTDTFSKEKRSEIMRQVKSSRNKSTELKLIAFFKSQSIKGWRRNYKLFGKPDFVFLKTKTAIFVDGCFWHGHNCRNTKPKDNKEYWDTKTSKNIQRDRQVTEYLIRKGWLVIRLWECELKNGEILKEKLATTHNINCLSSAAAVVFGGYLSAQAAFRLDRKSPSIRPCL